jgi:hypothetical protein
VIVIDTGSVVDTGSFIEIVSAVTGQNPAGRMVR